LLIRQGFRRDYFTHHGAFINLTSLSVKPLPVDPATWRGWAGPPERRLAPDGGATASRWRPKDRIIRLKPHGEGKMTEKNDIISRLTAQDVYGGNLVKTSRGYKTSCPLPGHDDMNPSFHIREPDLSFHCFGCGEKGDVFTFLMKRDRVSFPEALRSLADMAGVTLNETAGGHDNVYQVNKRAMELYRESLSRNSQALLYLTEERGLSRESIDRFRLGCTGVESTVYRLKKEGFPEEDLIASGVAISKDGHLRDFFWGRLVFPITSGGRTKGFGARAMGDSEVKYINSPASPVFQKRDILYGLDPLAIRERGFAILVEGYFDVIMCHQHRFGNAVATLGTALTHDHVRILKKHTDTVIVVPDADGPGKKAAERTVKLLFDSEVSGYVARLPDGEDPDSYLKKGHSLEDILDTALPFSVYLLRNNAKGTRQMLFNALLKRDTLSTAEFLAHVGTPEEWKVFQELEARTMLEKTLSHSTLVLRRKGVEIRKERGYLAVLSKGQFLFKQPVTGDHRKQAQKIMDGLIKLQMQPGMKTSL
jgi:DNA primase catalytic core